MHPLSLLLSTIVSGRNLHRLFMEPLGVHSDVTETFTSEVAFYHVYKKTLHLDYEELELLILGQMDDESGRNFIYAVNSIWDERALEIGRLMVRGFVGDDKRL